MRKDFELLQLTHEYKANLSELKTLGLTPEELATAHEQLTRNFVETVAGILALPQLAHDSSEGEDEPFIEL